MDRSGVVSRPESSQQLSDGEKLLIAIEQKPRSSEVGTEAMGEAVDGVTHRLPSSSPGRDTERPRPAATSSGRPTPLDCQGSNDLKEASALLVSAAGQTVSTKEVADGVSKASTLLSVETKRTQRDAVHIDEESDMARGSYGDVRRATLKGLPRPVAVKELRPAGTKRERLRVEIVSTMCLRLMDTSLIYTFHPRLSLASFASGLISTTRISFLSLPSTSIMPRI